MTSKIKFQPSSEVLEVTELNGQWIWGNDQRVPGTWMNFRNDFVLNEVPKSVLVKIAADSKYWLWINGELVVFEGQVKNGPSPKRIYFDQLEIQKYLRTGKNIVAVLVNYFGKNGYGFYDTGTPGLFFEAIGDNFELLSDTSWKSCVNPAYHEALPQADRSYRLAEPDINYHAKDALEGWTGVDFQDADWTQSVALDKPFEAMEVRPIPFLKVEPITIFTKDGVNTWREEELNDEYQLYTIKNHTNVQGTPYLKVNSPENQAISMYTDTWKELADNGDSICHVYRTKSGIQAFEALGWINGYEVYFEIPKTVEVLELGFRVSTYATEPEGKFVTDDDRFNTLYKKCYDTLLVTMRDTYMDCPDRERAQWMGDAVNEMQMAFYAMDENASYLYKKALNQVLNWRHESGILPTTVPNGLDHGEYFDAHGKFKPEDYHWEAFELPMQSLATVCSFWHYYLYSGDRQPIVDGFDALVGYLKLWDADEDDLILPRKGTWDWFDWGENFDGKILEHCWYYHAAKTVQKMAQLLDKPLEVVEFLKERETAIRENFETAFWDEEKQAYWYETENQLPDDRANAMTVFVGLANPIHKQAITNILMTRFEASPYMEMHVLQALFLMNEGEKAVERMLTRYKAMIENEYPTLWEFWEMKQGTRNHAWTGSPLLVMYRYMAGITPLEAGYRKVEIKPQLAHLKSVQVAVPTPQGKIELSMKQAEAFFEIEGILPKGMDAAEICLPKQSVEKGTVLLNQQVLFTDGVKVIDSTTITKDDGDFLRFVIDKPTKLKLEVRTV